MLVYAILTRSALLFLLGWSSLVGLLSDDRDLTAAADKTNGHVTIIVLDMSGSMGTNDPNGLRCSAANAYIDLSGTQDSIGIISLNNSNRLRTGVNNFEAAQEWTQPLNTATQAERENLRKIIMSKSSSCRPDGQTPTYDALEQAFNMLLHATQGKQLSGSVILLTDGAPYPDTGEQIQRIQSDLIPRFKDHNWPIDVVGLGKDEAVEGMNTTFHTFLSGISDGTSGKFYEDGKGEVQGISPLNITPFFVNIFARRVGRSVSRDIPPTPLDGGVTKRNFTVTNFTSSLDVVVVKDQKATNVALVTPGGQTITPDSGGALVSQDPHYVIYSIANPIAGQWEVNVSGSGLFMLNSLKVSNIQLIIDNVRLEDADREPSSVWPLGQKLNVTAHLTSSNQAITPGNNEFGVVGEIMYTGKVGNYSQQFTLNDNVSPGTFVGQVVVPHNAPAGSYDIHVRVGTVSTTSEIASDTHSIRLELFPEPLFIAPKTGKPSDAIAQTTVLQWPWLLQSIYSLPLMDRISSWPLQGYPAQQSTNISGIIQWQGQPYTQSDTSIQATATRQNSKTSIPVMIEQTGEGRFITRFIAPETSDYTIVFRTSGSYQDSHGDFGSTTRVVQVTVVPASITQVGFASGITFFYLLIVFFLYRLLIFWCTPRPFGFWVLRQDGEIVNERSFGRAHRGLMQWFFRRNHLYSRQAGLPRGLQFRFSYGKRIQVRAEGSGARDWQQADGSQLNSLFQPVTELIFRTGGENTNIEDVAYYTINAVPKKQNYSEGDERYDDEYAYGSIFSGRKRSRRSTIYEGYGSDEMDQQKKGRRRGRRGQLEEWNDF